MEKREQKEVIEKICADNPSATIFGSIGTISYDLKDIDHPKKHLVKGAMGHVMSIAFGYAKAKPDEEVICIIGDGSYLMKAGSAATLLHHDLPNLTVYVLNNQCYKSCGGQGTNFDALFPFVPFEVIPVC